MVQRFFSILLLVTLFTALPLLAQDAAPAGKITGYMFGDYFYNIARDTGYSHIGNAVNGGAKDYQAFQFRRIYFAYDDDISSTFASRFRLEADQSALSSDGKITVFVKDAYLKWKNVFQGSDAYFGIHPTPAFDISEGFWGYRSLEKTIMDLRGIVPSRDLGAALRGKFDDEGTVNYWAMIGDGTGNKPETDKYKRYYFTLWLKPSSNFQATLYADYKDGEKIDDPTSTSAPKATLSHGSLTTAAFLGYNQPDAFRLGVEGFYQSNSNDYTEPSATSPTSRPAMGLSVYGIVTLAPEYAAVVRYDYFDPNSNSSAKGDSRNYIIAGLDYKADKRVSIMPNFLFETFESTTAGHSFDASITGRVTIYYQFL
jgi:hypothetical protein